MWDGRIDPRRLKASAGGKQFLPPSSSNPIPLSFPASPSIPIPPPFHVSPPFHPSPNFPPSRCHPPPSSLPAASPPSHHHSIHPAVLASSCPPHHPSFVTASSVHHSIHRSPSYPASTPRPTPSIQPSLHALPPVAVAHPPGSQTSPLSQSLHPPSLLSNDRRGVCVPQELHRRYEAAPESTKTKALQTVIEMKVNVCFFVVVMRTSSYSRVYRSPNLILLNNISKFPSLTPNGVFVLVIMIRTLLSIT